jgi:non-specific serine/threonine protein kinase
VVPNDLERSPKLEYLMEQLKELKALNSAALVFSQFTKCLDLIEEDLKKENIKYLRIDGSVSIKNRKIIVQAFQDPQSDIQVLLLSLKTGGIGLNLTRASYVFHIDPWWNPAVENQASDRAYRLGQKKQVIITRILMKHSIEEKMMGLKKEKSDLFAAVVEGSQVKFGKTLSKKDFDFLLS